MSRVVLPDYLLCLDARRARVVSMSMSALYCFRLSTELVTSTTSDAEQKSPCAGTLPNFLVTSSLYYIYYLDRERPREVCPLIHISDEGIVRIRVQVRRVANS